MKDKSLRDIIVQTCSKHFDIHDEISCGDITQEEGLKKMSVNIDQAQADILKLVPHIDEIEWQATGFIKEMADNYTIKDLAKAIHALIIKKLEGRALRRVERGIKKRRGSEVNSAQTIKRAV